LSPFARLLVGRASKGPHADARPAPPARAAPREPTICAPVGEPSHQRPAHANVAGCRRRRNARRQLRSLRRRAQRAVGVHFAGGRHRIVVRRRRCVATLTDWRTMLRSRASLCRGGGLAVGVLIPPDQQASKRPRSARAMRRGRSITAIRWRPVLARLHHHATFIVAQGAVRANWPSSARLIWVLVRRWGPPHH